MKHKVLQVNDAKSDSAAEPWNMDRLTRSLNVGCKYHLLEKWTQHLPHYSEFVYAVTVMQELMQFMNVYRSSSDHRK